MCLYYKTGAGKTFTALASMKALGEQTVIVVAPPTTHQHWIDTGAAIGIGVSVMSHALFRQKKRKLSKTQALIVDELHLLGGYKAIGWKKLESISLRLEAPLIIASATPNYNDVERCYCIQRITDPRATAGGYLTFIYKHCNTEVNPFGHVPRVVEFLHYPDAAAFLADLDHVMYIEDDLVYDIEDIHMVLEVPAELMILGIDRRKERVCASQIEQKHSTINHMLVTDTGMLQQDVVNVLVEAVQYSPTPTLVFATHKDVMRAAERSLIEAGFTALGVSGSTQSHLKQEAVDSFKSGQVQALLGTVTLATGTDGLDKMCDTLVILDDTEDNAMRRQLIGRIMPRGIDTPTTHSNRVIRVVPEPLPV